MAFYLPNPDAVDDLMADELFRGNLARFVDPARQSCEDLAKRIMPRRAAAFQVQTDDEDEAVRLVNTDYGGIIAEFGSRNNPAFAPLRRGAESAGLRLDENPPPD